MKFRDYSALLGWILFSVFIIAILMCYYCWWNKGVDVYCWIVSQVKIYEQDEVSRKLIDWGINGASGIKLLGIGVAVFFFLTILWVMRALAVKIGFFLQDFLSYKSGMALVLKRNLKGNEKGSTFLRVDITQCKNDPVFMIKIPGCQNKKSILGLLDDKENQHFCYFSLLNGKFWAQSFEERSTELFSEESKLDEKIKAISLFYNNLIAASNNKELQKLFQKIQSAYSEENITNAIKTINDNRYSLGLAFIGDKVGLLDYEEDTSGEKLCTYLTDHFTWKVFKHIYQNNKEVFVEAFRMLGKRKSLKYREERSLIMKSLFFLFSSMGVDLVVHGKNRKGKEFVLAAIRSGKLQDDGTSRIHIAVDESFSNTDLENKVPDCKRWIERGVEEEIGYKADDLKFVLYDFSITYQLGEIGLCGDVEIANIDEAIMKPGQDKYLEMKALMAFPFPCHWYNLYKFYLWIFPDMELMKRLVTESVDDERMRLKWVGFAPLIYARFFMRYILRRSQLSNFDEIASYSFVAANILLLLGIIVSGVFGNGVHLLVLLFMILVTYLWPLKVLFSKLYKRVFGYKLEPFVPQWTGDVTVLQNTVAGTPFSGKDIYIKDDSSLLDEEIDIDRYVVKSQPKCAVRRKADDTAVEVPLVFFNVECKKFEGEAGQIKFLHFFLHKTEKDICYYEVYQIHGNEDATDSGISGNTIKSKRRNARFVSMSFNFPPSRSIKVHRKGTEFNDTEQNDKNKVSKRNFKYYFNLSDDVLKDTKMLGHPILNGEYLTDFFKFNDDYYFSSVCGDNPDMGALIDSLFDTDKQKYMSKKVERWSEISELDALYKDVKGWQREAHVVLENQEKYAVVIYKLSLNDDKLINNKIDRSWSYINGRLLELEVLALQFILVREMQIYIGRKKRF